MYLIVVFFCVWPTLSSRLDTIPSQLMPIVTRISLTDAQRTLLLQFYERNPLPSLSDLQSLVEVLKIQANMISTWFENERARRTLPQPLATSQCKCGKKRLILSKNCFY